MVECKRDRKIDRAKPAGTDRNGPRPWWFVVNRQRATDSRALAFLAGCIAAKRFCVVVDRL
jgi:hypothetical protein